MCRVSLHFVHALPFHFLPFYLLSILAAFCMARVSQAQFTQQPAMPTASPRLVKLWIFIYDARCWLSVKQLKSENLNELPTFPTPCLCAYSFLPRSNFNKNSVTTWCWHSMSNIIPSVSRENVKTCVSITLRFQFSTVKNQATLKLQAAFQSYLVIFIAFVFWEAKFRCL